MDNITTKQALSRITEEDINLKRVSIQLPQEAITRLDKTAAMLQISREKLIRKYILLCLTKKSSFPIPL